MISNIYKIFLDSLPSPVWIAEPDTTIKYINPAYEKAFGTKSEEVLNQKYTSLIVKDKVKQYRVYMDRCINNKEPYNIEYQKNGFCLQCTLFPLMNEAGEVEAVAGFVIDISEQIQKTEELKHQKNILRTIIDALPQTIFYKDTSSRFLGYNKAFELYYKDRGYEVEIGRSDLELYPDKEVAKSFIEKDQEVMLSKQKCFYEQTIEEGGLLRIEENIKIPIIGENNEATGVVGISTDITEKKQFQEKLQYLSQTDALTGLYNRHSFESKLLKYNKIGYLPLGIILGDVNGLKLVNDAFGHLKGDRLLRDMGKVLKRVTDGRGDVFRWGGDEFMILLPNHDETMCEQVIDEIKQECLDYDDYIIQMSIALGYDVKRVEEDPIDEYIKRIEDALYRNKLLDKKSIRSSILSTLQASLEEKNMETNEHATRVIEHSVAISKLLKFKQDEQNEVVLVAQLHDIGKVAMPEALLQKNGPLTDEEYTILKTHSEKGYRIIMACGELNNVAKSVLTHHERWDGKGYPLGLEGENIPIMARIVGVVDAYDVMVNERVYKKAMTQEDAIAELRKGSGTQFDPMIVDLLINEVLLKKSKTNL